MWQAVKDFFTTVTNPIEAFSWWIVELSIQLLNFFLGSIVSVTKIDTEYQKVQVIQDVFSWVRFLVYALVGVIVLHQLFKQYLAISTGSIQRRTTSQIMGDIGKFAYRLLMLPLFLDIMIKLNSFWVGFISDKGLVVDQFVEFLGLKKDGGDKTVSEIVLGNISQTYQLQMAGTVVFVAIFFLVLLAILFVLMYIQMIMRLGQIVFCYVLIPFVALSALNEEMDMYSTWWRETIAIVGTAAAQVSFLYLGLNCMLSGHAILGTGILIGVVTTPAVLQKFVYSTGVASGTGSMMKFMTRQVLMKRR
ncbi:conjugal transfer protein TrbL family protein [Bacillus cereus]|uniref:conjugal transfer protein TrbL family protein n=1 Tax=Bacillus cereus TaxID=1396 RepID=UPI0018F6072F|nr:conjugal transfer protein TrbL family protein [Bacillus cereus]MBJ8024222.1 conjugal transfer protein TraL [Bacillus cereus]MBJ8036781.1 conjugal transfer protein TraL [Bacillus cereus]